MLSVQLSLITLFLNLNLDLLVVGRTAPNHSWRNPVEQIINLRLQCIGIMHSEGSVEFEKAANNLKALRRASEENYRNDAMVSLSSPVNLLQNITSSVERKDFLIFESSTNQITAFWEVLTSLDDSLIMQNTSKSILDKKERLKSFFDHCCQVRCYSFCVKKCSAPSCTICKPVQMEAKIFTIFYLIMGSDDHYVPFAEIYGKTTNEDHCTSLAKSKSLTFTN